MMMMMMMMMIIIIIIIITDYSCAGWKILLVCSAIKDNADIPIAIYRRHINNKNVLI